MGESKVLVNVHLGRAGEGRKKNSVVEHKLSVGKALGSIPSTVCTHKQISANSFTGLWHVKMKAEIRVMDR